jgi:anti-sigma factor ChrR (cupin superfamily)
MTAMTPNMPEHETLAGLASRYVDVAALPWVPTRFEGVELKILMEDKETGLLTALTRFAPGAVLPDHEHVELEQTFVLEGSLVDDEGVATAGNYVWRPAGSRHSAHSPDGCLALSFFLRPNKFFDTP